MTALRTVTSLLAAAIVLLALPMAAGAEYYVPPGNSAATQYTEALPTAGGDRDAAKGKSKAEQRSPAKVLGSRNARRLEAQGPAGRAAAKLAAETSPAAEAPGAGSGSGKVAPAGRGGVLSGGGPRQAGGTAPGDTSRPAGKLDRQIAAEEPGDGPSGGSGSARSSPRPLARPPRVRWGSCSRS